MNKNRNKKTENEFGQLEKKIFFRTAVSFFAAVCLTFGLYSFVLAGKLANGVVAFLTLFVGEYDAALDIYEQVVRKHIDFFILLAILMVFLFALRFYLKSFTKYFNEINRGIDALLDENAGDVTLSLELAAVEKKINSIKHTLAQRKLEAEIEKKRKNDLVVYLAHDLKTPLTSVIGYLTLLLDETQISEELREKYLSIALHKAERLEDLTNEFFEITRFQLSDSPLTYSCVNLTRLLEQLTYEFWPMFLEKNLKYELKIAANTMLRCDVDKMQRVFDNLLRNAVKYSFSDSTIYITAEQQENSCRIAFINFGTAIPQEKLEQMFEQFYRLDTARSSNSGGAGLGLAIAKEIVELHGGSITAKSENERIEFVVTIPLL